MAGSIAVDANGDYVQGGLLGNNNIAQLIAALQQAFGLSGTGNSTTNQTQKQSGSSTQTSTGSQNVNASTTGTATQIQTGQSTNVADVVNQIIGATTGQTTQTGTQAGTQDVTSQVALQLLSSVFPQLQAQLSGGGFTRENAIADSRGAIGEVIRTLQEQTLPQVYSAQSGRGAYNSSTARLMANDLTARAAGQAAAIQGQNIASYANIQANQSANLLNAINSAVAAQRSMTSQQTGQQTTGTTQQTTQNQIGQTTQVGTTAQQSTGQTTGTQQQTTQNQGTVTGTQDQTTETKGETNTSQKQPGLIQNGAFQTTAGVVAGITSLIPLFNAIGGPALVQQITNWANGLGGGSTGIPTGPSGEITVPVQGIGDDIPPIVVDPTDPGFVGPPEPFVDDVGDYVDPDLLFPA